MTCMKTFWRNYCENSSLHGLRYIVHKEAKPWERFAWAMLLAIASIAILVHLYASWKTYSYSTMQIVVDDPRYPLSKIDFPAITICSINKILYTKAKKLILNKYKHDTELRNKYEHSLYVMGMLQYPNYRDLSFFIKNKSVINLPLENITNLMLKLMPTVDDVFERCYWRGTEYNCSDIIRLQRTEEGFCYSFNSKTSERSANDSKINPPIAGPNNMLIPLRNNAAGKMTGLEVVLKNLLTEYFPNDELSRGFNIIIHTPEDLPDISSGYKIYSEQSSRISIDVSHIKADKSLNRISEKDRNCFMYELRSTKEKNLLNYRSNAEDNCYSKCRLKTTYKMCYCTPYYFNVNENIRTCGIEHIQCLGNMNVLQRNVKAQEKEPGFPKWSIPVFMNCSCPNLCSFISYKTEIRNYASRKFVGHTLSRNAYTHIDIHYKQRFAISYQRSIKYTTQDLLVTFGDMASLFLGCTLVSILEIIYVVFKSLLMLKKKLLKIIQ